MLVKIDERGIVEKNDILYIITQLEEGAWVTTLRFKNNHYLNWKFHNKEEAIDKLEDIFSKLEKGE